MQIIIADQNVQHRHKMLGTIEARAHTVQEALTGREVVECCRKKCPDLLFIDTILAGENGIEIVRQVRQTGGHAVWVPIVLMGEKISDPEIMQGIEAGVDDVILKPLSEAQVMLKVCSALRHLNLKEEVFKVAHELVVVNRALQNVITQDVLTGIDNSNSFEEALEQEWFTTKKLNTCLSLVLLNLDFFQAYNQTYGAEAGDQVIKQVAMALKMALPTGNATLARTTGETFAVLLPNVGRASAFEVAEKLHKAIDDLKIPHQNSGCSDHITASFGVATVEQGGFTKPWDLKDSADFALYQAKHYGRNRVVAVPVVSEEVKN